MRKQEVKVDVSLPVIVFKEGNSFVAFTPALDLSAYGRTLEKARERFVEIVQIFFQEVVNKGSLDEVLGELGWKKGKSAWSPPVVVCHDTETVRIPAHASAFA